MLRGIDDNEIIVGAYVDNHSGGICPMLAAHRCGERTTFGTFARAWDQFTDADPKKPRPATRREVRALRSYLENSLVGDDISGRPWARLSAASRPRAGASPRPRPARTAASSTSSTYGELGPMLSPGRTNISSGTMQFGEVRSRKRTPSAMSSGRIISSASTCSLTKSVIGVSTKPGHSAVTWIPSAETSFWVDWLKPTTPCLVAE